jgi:YVTN family beta-propeller protein
VYVSLNGENAVGKVDVGTRQLVGKVTVGVGPIQVFATPDGKYVLAANQGIETSPSDTVSIIDTASLEVVATVRTDAGAHGVVKVPLDKPVRAEFELSNVGDQALELAGIPIVEVKEGC